MYKICLNSQPHTNIRFLKQDYLQKIKNQFIFLKIGKSVESLLMWDLLDV